MKAALLTACLAGCATNLDPSRACEEAGIAMGARLEECSGDTDAALALIETFEAGTTCVASADTGVEEAQNYECALIVRNLACELVLDYGDDLSQWLSTSSCPAILELR